MAIYAVLAKGTGPLISAALARAYPESYYNWTGDTFFLRTTDSPREIGTALSVMTKDESGAVAGVINNIVIIQVRRTYWGFAGPNLWSWLRAAFGQDTP